jgi:hypothetical protein
MPWVVPPPVRALNGHRNRPISPGPANKPTLRRPFRAHGLFQRITRGIGRRTPSAPGSDLPTLRAVEGEVTRLHSLTPAISSTSTMAGFEVRIPLVLVLALDPDRIPNGDPEFSPGL